MLNKIFNYYEKEVRTALKDGEVWFAAKDICNILDLSQPTRALSGLDEEDLALLKVRADEQNREMNFVNEAGLYNLIFKSRKPEARAFKRWVTSEVLPALRRQKYYLLLSDKPTYEERRAIVNAILGENSKYGEKSEITGEYRLIPCLCYNRSCKNAKINATFNDNQPLLPGIIVNQPAESRVQK